MVNVAVSLPQKVVVVVEILKSGISNTVTSTSAEVLIHPLSLLTTTLYLPAATAV
ncbi:hypothetical protein D3C80_622610 [compost metagenome]